MPPLATAELESHLNRFGLQTFRPGQREVIETILAGDDCLCIMPTGGGKSLCFQLPAVVREGLTLVVSPLIALMKDQVDSLSQIGIRATFINSSLPPAEQRARMGQMAASQFDLVYVAPERLRNPGFLEAVRATRVQLLAVDEAHCVSEWGHDFRPDYARLGRFRSRLGMPQTIALTATATPTVRDDIVLSLNLREPKTFVTGFARPNLRFEVQMQAGNAAKNEALLALLHEIDGAGIIYASTRKRCEELVEMLGEQLRRRVGLYHAGMMSDDRRRVQDEFMAGQIPIIVATNAFGMGIDKADLRFVIHNNLPGSLEAYYQEAGRAGRDGQFSRCVLLFDYQDRFLQEFFIDNAYPSREMVAQVYEYLRQLDDDPIELTLQEIKDRLQLSVGAEGVGACERLLEKCGAIERLDSQQNMASVKIDSQLPTLVDLLSKDAKVQRKVLRAAEAIVGELRGERIYFHPRQLTERTELKWEPVARALKELTRLRDFDYVPPFRGRAVHLLARDVPFDELSIDFEELDRRKKSEYEKLEHVIDFARTRGCRQRRILKYFGDPDLRPCGKCDNCPSEHAPAAASAVTNRDVPAAVLEAVRMALSGVARAHGRVGKHLVAKMLCGSKSTELKRNGMHKLSTFGLLRDLKQTEAVELLDGLIQAGLIDQIEAQKFRPLVQLSERGSEVMRDGQYEGVLPLTQSLLAKLRARRVTGSPVNIRPTEVKRETPPTETRPANSPNVPEPSTEATHAPVEPLHAAPNERTQSPDSESRATVTAEARRGASYEQAAEQTDEPATVRPAYYWTWRLLTDGYSAHQCAEIRQLDEAQMLDHVLRAADEGLPVILNWFLSAQQIAALENLLGDSLPARLRPVLEQSPPGTTLRHVKLFLICREQARSLAEEQ